MSINLNKEAWKDVKEVLTKHNIPYTTQLHRRDIPKSMGEPDAVVTDKHITINIVIPDYFEEDT